MDQVYRPGWAKEQLANDGGEGFMSTAEMHEWMMRRPLPPITLSEVAKVDELAATLTAVTRSAEAAIAPQTPFHALMDEVRAMHDAKNKDYADDADPFKNFRDCEDWGLSAFDGVYTRMGDKWRRGKNLQRRRFLDKGGPAVSEESLEDTLMDLGIYCLIAVLLLREERESLELRTPRTGAHSAS